MIARSQLLALFAIAVLVMGGALLINSRSNKTAPDVMVGTKVLPALADRINDVSEVHVLAASNKPFVTLKRTVDKTGWQVMECGGYRADFQKLREFLLKLSELEVVEVKTANAASYPQLGVEDIENPAATGKRIDFIGLSAPLGLILGKNAASSGNYVRIVGKAPSYLAKPQVVIYNEPKVWLDHSVMDIPAGEVQEVRVQLAEGKPAERSYAVARTARDQNDFSIPKLPAGKKPSPGAANANADALAGVALEDVRAAQADEKWDSGVSRAEFRLFDGTIVTALGRTEKTAGTDAAAEKHYVRFEVIFDEAQQKRFPPKIVAPQTTKPPGQATPPAFNNDPAQVRAGVQKLQAQVGGWVFELPAFKYNAIFRPLDELAAKS